MSTGQDGRDFLGRLLLGRYRVVRKLATGGMGLIYLARAEGAAGYVKPVVVKQLIPHVGEDDEMVRMFVREAHVLAQLSHPNIVDVIDFAEEDGAYLLVLEYVHGYHLGHWYRYLKAERRAFPVSEALHILVRVLDALHYAHTRTDPDGSAAPIVHRDVSPSNVLIDVDGYVKLADFGIARVASVHTPYRTDTPSIKGKLSYLAPELLRAMDPSPRSDVFAAGVVLHEVLSGRNEFYRRDMTQTMQRILEHHLTPLHALRDDVPDGIDEILTRATAKDPADRYPDAASFARALRALLREDDAPIAADLRAHARRDFLGRLPEVRKVPPLVELERAWREPPDSKPPRDVPVSRPSSQPPTRLERPVPASLGMSEPASPPARRRWSWLGGGVLLVLAGAAALWALSWAPRREAAEPPRYIVVSAGSTARPDASEPPPVTKSALAPAVEPPSATKSAAAERAAAPAAAKPAGGRRSPPLQVRLTRAFTRRRPQIERCLRRHAGDVPSGERVQVRFEVDARGRIRAVSLEPATAAESPLGRCILQVARTTRFPSTGAPLAFRIPVRLRAE